MRLRKAVGRILFFAVVTYFAPGWKVFAQAGAGYMKVNTSPVTALTYTDTSISDGDYYQYEITAVDSVTGQESTPLVANFVQIPASGVHSVTTKWGASPTASVTYNVYRTQILPPNPPVAGSSTVN
jgi:hypothetical protein